MWIAIAASVGVIAVTWLASVLYFRRSRAAPVVAAADKDVVILHQFSRGATQPSMSPFCLKLETYLRVAKIPYRCDFGSKMSSKGKMPWIEYNGQAVADSSFIIDFLREHVAPHVDLDANLTAEQKAIARAFKVMTEESLQWGIAYTRWIKHAAVMAATGFPDVPAFLAKYVIGPSVTKTVMKSGRGQGILRHSEAEVYDIVCKDLQAIITFLGAKSYLMGSELTTVDCTLFGHLAQLVYDAAAFDSPLHRHARASSTLCAYVERVRARCFPDWNTLLRSPIPQ